MSKQKDTPRNNDKMENKTTTTKTSTTDTKTKEEKIAQTRKEEIDKLRAKTSKYYGNTKTHK